MAVAVFDDDEGRMRSDEEWVEAALRDMSAFAHLYDRYYLLIYQYCRIRLKTAQEAEDATNETFERAMRSLSGFRGGSFRSWLFSIVANHVRNTARDSRPMVPLPPGPEPPDLDPMICPEEAALARERAHVMQRLLAALSVVQRQVVELRLVGLSAPEIAEVLEMSVSAVKVAQWRAFKRLRDLLDGEDKDVGSTETTDV